ncbi:heparinase II/III family protein [Pseudoruegeria sp. SHC-113]|uniref:heparinase II/III family protein n=1 Tax=Pseudoruegeria sp. SHC-113 TaxID=2855439 RepID=UPI0021BB7201|nr:heparinase II/III family protein [Pseudoruegeria sp. SHC-113]MCT8159013.1 heparinase II/III family protein [Pseudoruegeria sp. SHC-113]
MNRYTARRSALTRPATALVSQPEPRSIGSFARGRQLTSGNFLFAGYLVRSDADSIWEVPVPAPRFEEEVQGCAWLDDLAALNDARAREAARAWVMDWVRRYGRGGGAGWTPDLTGRRLIRWINHALVILNGLEKPASEQFFRSLAQQTVFLSKRWQSAQPGLPRFEALCGLIYAGLSLEGMERFVPSAVRALGRECAEQVNIEGGIPTRNPEELLEVFTLLVWTSDALHEEGRTPHPEHLAAIERIAPTLRALRHNDGGLARFHGGGRGLEGRLDHALSAAGVRPKPLDGLAMGFARLHGGRASVIVDASAPPRGWVSRDGHASTLAFEMTEGRRPVIVNCGSGVSFGETWRRAGRATASHSTLGIEGYSSSRLGTGGLVREEEKLLLTDTPSDVRYRLSSGPAGMGFQAGHDGYVKTHGLTHIRQLDLRFDGRELAGEDTLAIVEEEDKAQFDAVLTQNRLQGVHFTIRFHLHPDVDAEVDLGGTAVSLALKSGEIWVFRYHGKAQMSLEPSVYLEKTRLKPRATKQIVLSARAMDYATRITWTLAMAQDSPVGLRDLGRDVPYLDDLTSEEEPE